MSRLSKLQDEGYTLEKVVTPGTFGESIHYYIPKGIKNFEGKPIYIMKKGDKRCIITEDE